MKILRFLLAALSIPFVVIGVLIAFMWRGISEGIDFEAWIWKRIEK